MGERWIVGLDGSPDSRAALDWARHHSAGRDVDLDVVYADHEGLTDRIIGAFSGQRPPDPDLGTDVEYRIVDGSPGGALVDAAANGSLLVVGRRGAGGGWLHTLGSVSRYCVSHCSVPTVVVPTGWHPGRTGRIVVGFDGSAQSSGALGWATAFSDAGTDLRALIAIEIAPWLREDLVRARLGDELDAEERRLRDLLGAADPEGRARPDVVVGDARPALARAAELADLVVLGAHGAGRHGSTLLGSVAGWMLEGSTTPIVVVPAPPTS